MRASIIIATHNEGAALSRTIESCIDSAISGDCEIVISDDASNDGSVDDAESRFPLVRIIRHNERRGASPAKDLGARNARGDTLIFLDAHTKPEAGAISRLINDIETLGRKAIVTPTIAALQEGPWQSDLARVGHGYAIDLRSFEPHWLPLDELQRVAGARGMLESPALMGAAFAISRSLYETLWGFDRSMRSWGLEDLDFGLRSWQFGYPILHDPDAVIGHRFRDAFETYDVPLEHVLLNKLRMARKNFTESVWSDWLASCRESSEGMMPGHPEGLWAYVWQLFEQGRQSVEQERSYVQAHRDRDEFGYAERFGLAWPRIGWMAPGGNGVSGGAAPLGPAVSGAARPSPRPTDAPQRPSPAPSAAPPLGYSFLYFGGPGGATC